MDNKYQVPYINKENFNDSIYDDLKIHEHKVEKLKKGKYLDINSLNNIVLFIIKGRLKLVISNSVGAEKIVFYFQERTFCSPYLPELVNTVNIKMAVDEECEIAYLPRPEFINYMISNREKLEELLIAIGKRFAILYSNMLDLQSETSRNRIYSFIYQIALINNKEAEGGNIMINNFPSKRDVSLITGVHTRNIYKYITDLENLNIAEKVKEGLVVKDIRKLELLIEEGYKS